MFFVRELPSDQLINEFARSYPQIDPSALKVCGRLLRLATDMIAALERYLRPYDLSQGRFYTLLTLFRTPKTPLSPSQLAELIGVTRATLTGLINSLERDGLVIRKASADDRRKVLVHLTADGIAKLEAIIPEYYQCIRELMQVLDETDRDHLYNYIDRIQSHLTDLGY